MRAESSANDAPYWPACAREPGFLPWLHRILNIARNVSDDVPTHELARIAGMHGTVPTEWGLAALFLMEQSRPTSSLNGHT